MPREGSRGKPEEGSLLPPDGHHHLLPLCVYCAVLSICTVLASLNGHISMHEGTEARAGEGSC